MCSVQIVNEVVFSAYNYTNTFLASKVHLRKENFEFLCRLANTSIMTLVELITIKVRMQNNEPGLGHGRYYSSALYCARCVERQEGDKTNA